MFDDCITARGSTIYSDSGGMITDLGGFDPQPAVAGWPLTAATLFANAQSIAGNACQNGCQGADAKATRWCTGTTPTRVLFL